MITTKEDEMNTQDKSEVPFRIQREILPIPDIPHVGLTTYDAKDPDTKYPPIEPLRPPKGAPNVLVILIDDCGFGASSAFGGPIHTPAAERLAANGLKYNRFHTTALCSPTQALRPDAIITSRWVVSPRWPPRWLHVDAPEYPRPAGET
jgi:hypothetical protein